MCRNFEFLKEKNEFKSFSFQCLEAEKSIIVSSATCAILSRMDLELAVKWVYANDSDLVLPMNILQGILMRMIFMMGIIRELDQKSLRIFMKNLVQRTEA